MSKVEIIKTIRTLAQSQGYYSGLYNQLMYFAKNDTIAFDEYMTELGEKVDSALDLIMYFEG